MFTAIKVFWPVLVLAIFTSSLSRAADLKIGDNAPNWSSLPGTDEKTHSLSDYKNANLLIMAFSCNHCPVAQAYEDRLITLQNDYQNKGVQLITVNVNNIPDDRLDKMIERAASKGFNFPYLYDETQKIGQDYGAKVTPHIFLFDKNRKLVYMGAVDDNMKVDQVKKHYLRDAIDAQLAGKTPPEAVTKQFGCSIKYESENKLTAQ
ncbi:MAG TPA: thioredoxin family protein [Thermoguttaceae bacterium]